MGPETSHPSQTQVDLTNCDREPIHIIGGVQDFGCLVSVTSDWIVNHASENVYAFLGVTAQDLVGEPLAGLFASETLHTLRTKIQLLATPDSVERAFNIAISDELPDRFDIAIYRSGRSIVFELQRHESGLSADHLASVRSMIGRLQNAGETAAICNLAARYLKALSGFDRVMVYRFAQDGSGEVVAEAAEGGLEPYLGLHYPASDIPKQARELYKRNLLRIISDIDSGVSPLHPQASPEGDRLDLSLSAIRAVSPIHIEYLRNMGVRASMSVSILRRGKLWGLFACHHYSPRRLPYDLRSAVELFGQMFAFTLDQCESDAVAAQAARARNLHDSLMTQLAGDSTLATWFAHMADSVAEVIPCDGVALWAERECQLRGSTPTEAQMRGLVKYLNTADTGRVFSTSTIGKAYVQGAEFAAEASGVLAIPVSRRPRDYLILFRREIVRSVTWAGNPEKPAEIGPNGIRLTPRSSFESWKETVRGQSAEWTDSEIEIAESLRTTLLKVVLRLADVAEMERLRARERQDLLIAELNHRVRNILNLIRGLVTKSGEYAETIDQFTSVVGDRIQALARAHDQITRENWSPAPLHSLIEIETEAYLDDGKARVAITGPNPLLTPKAFTTVSLVIHELTTNSAKYGALSSKSGRVAIAVEHTSGKGVRLRWEEQGGPEVTKPERIGFGSTIIERSIPFELGGTAEIDYRPEGLVANFSLPAEAVAGDAGEDAHPVARKSDRKAALTPGEKPRIGGPALILEDSIIIAMDVERALSDLGADPVRIASTVNDAMTILDAKSIVFALLDVNLGKETSLKVAERLRSEGIPFVFSTGYGEGEPVVKRFPRTEVLSKPFDRASLVAAVARALATRG